MCPSRACGSEAGASARRNSEAGREQAHELNARELVGWLFTLPPARSSLRGVLPLGWPRLWARIAALRLSSVPLFCWCSKQPDGAEVGNHWWSLGRQAHTADKGSPWLHPMTTLRRRHGSAMPPPRAWSAACGSSDRRAGDSRDLDEAGRPGAERRSLPTHPEAPRHNRRQALAASLPHVREGRWRRPRRPAGAPGRRARLLVTPRRCAWQRWRTRSHATRSITCPVVGTAPPALPPPPPAACPQLHSPHPCLPLPPAAAQPRRAQPSCRPRWPRRWMRPWWTTCLGARCPSKRSRQQPSSRCGGVRAWGHG